SWREHHRVDPDLDGNGREATRTAQGSSPQRLVHPRALECGQPPPGTRREASPSRGQGAANESPIPRGEDGGRDQKRTYRDGQGATRRAPRPGRSAAPAPPRAHHGLRYPPSAPRGARLPGTGRGGGIDVVWTKLRGHAPPGRLLRRQDP